MGRVQSTLVLQDQMSKVLYRINKAMGLTLDSFEAVQKASGKSFNSANIAAARREIGAANAALNEMEQLYQNCNAGQEQLNKKMEKGSASAGGLLGKLKGVASAYLGMKTVGGMVGLSDTTTQTGARLSMMNDGRQTTEELNDMIYASAQRSRGAYLATADAVSKLGLMAGDAFSSNEETVAFMEQVNKKFKIAGTSASGIDAAMLQLTQAMGSGVLRGEEYNSILEQAPNIIQAIADYMDVPKGQLKEMAADGQITAGIVKAAMFACADETNAKFESMPKTWSDIWTSMKNRAIGALGPVLKKINQLANSEQVQNAVNGLLGAFSAVVGVLVRVFEGVCAVYNFISENWDWIGPIVMVVVGAFLAYQAAVMVATAAQWLLNAAMSATPVGLIIAGIIVLIALVAVFFEQIMGAFYWFGALIENVIFWIANVVVAIWNSIKNIIAWIKNVWSAVCQIFGNIVSLVKNVGNGIGNVFGVVTDNIGVAFNNAWVSVQTGFWTMLNVIMQGLKSLAEKANKCLGWMGVDIDTSGFDFASKKIDELSDKKKSYKSVSDAWSEGFKTFEYGSVAEAFRANKVDFGEGWREGMSTFDVFQKGWGSDAFNSGAAAGASIKDSVTGIFGNMLKGMGTEDGQKKPFSYDDALDDIVDNTGDTADNTGKSSEELSYLRDIAERDAINRFTTAEIRVDLGGVTNNVSSNTDLDGIISYLTDGVAEALATASEGVY